MCFLCLFPSTEIINGDKIDVQVKDIGVLFQDILIGWAVIIIPCNPLCFIGIEIIQIFLCHIPGASFVYDFIDYCYRRLCKDADAWCYDLVVVRIIFYGKIGFIFPGDQYITLSVFHERGRCASGSGVQDKYVFVKVSDEFFNFVLVSVIFIFCIGPAAR